MGENLYVANSLQVFWQPILYCAIVFIVAAFGIWKIVSARQSGETRAGQKKSGLDLGLMLAVSVLILVGIFELGSSAYTFVKGAQTLTARLTEKDLVTRNTPRGSGGAYRLYYGNLNWFEIPDKAAYDSLVQGNCYEVTFYDRLDPVALLDQSETGMHGTSFVAGIKQMAASQCPN
jgi:hypothetical protein